MFGGIIGGLYYIKHHHLSIENESKPRVKISKKTQLGYFLFITGIFLILGYLILKY